MKIYLTIMFTLLFVGLTGIVCDLCNLHWNHIYINNIAIKSNTFVQSNSFLIKSAIKYYEKEFIKCHKNVRVEFINAEALKLKDTLVLGVAVTHDTWYSTEEVYVCTKNKSLCEIFEVLIHELEHACGRKKDCYEDQNCWSYKLELNRYKMCNEIIMGDL